MKTYRLVHETPAHYVIHDLRDKKNFHIAKKGIDKNTSDTIKSLPPMNPVGGYDNDMPDNRDITGTDPRPVKQQPQHYADGGNVKSSDDTSTDSKKDTSMDTATTDDALPSDPYVTSYTHPAAAAPQTNFIPHFDDGGRVTPQDLKEIQAAKDDPLAKQYAKEDLAAQYPKGRYTPKDIKQYDDGGTVTTDPDKAKEVSDSFKKALGFSEGGDTSYLEDLKNTVTKAFEGPKINLNLNPTPPPEDKNTRIRRENSERAQGTRPAQLSDDPEHQTDYSDGGKVRKFAAGTMEGTVQDAINADQTVPKQITTASTDAAMTAVPQANPNLPPDFNDRVKQEQFRLGANAGLPVTVTGENPANVDLEQFRPKAETNVAAQHQAEQAQLEQVAKDTYSAQVDQVNADNAIRAKSGLDPLDVPPPPSFPGAPTMPSQPGTTVPLDQQISFAPKSAQSGMGLPMNNVGAQYAAGIKQETEGIQAGANAQSEGSRQATAAMQTYLDNQQTQQKVFEQENEGSKRHLDMLERAVTIGKIDPNRYWNSKSTGGKIAASIGLLFGGIGAGLTKQPNAALEIMQNAIKQDIEAQMTDKSNEMSLYKVGLEKYRDSRAAQQFATLQANALLQGQLAKVAQSTGSAQAQATAQQMIGALKAQSAPMKQKLDLESMQMRMLNQPSPQGAGVDTTKLRTMINLGFIKPELAPKVMEEYGQYNQLRDTLNHTDDVFRKGLELSNATESTLPGFLPTLRPSSREYEALRDSWLGGITKETEGRVTPQDIKLMEKSFPTYLDRASPEVFNAKLNNIKDMIRNKYKFSELPANNLINPNDPVITPSSTRNKRFTPGAPTTGR